MIKSATLRDVEKHITNCLRQNDIHTGLRLIVDHFHEPLYWAIRKWVLERRRRRRTSTHLCAIYKGLASLLLKVVKTWCYRIAYNEAMRFLESNKKRVRLKEEIIAYRLENLYADPYFDADAADASLQRIIAELDDNQREVFCMKYYDELKFSEIAQITNRNENSVKTLFYKAKEILSNQIVLS